MDCGCLAFGWSTDGLFSVRFWVGVWRYMAGEWSPTVNPGDVSMETAAEVDGGLVERLVGESCPEIELVAVAMTSVAVVAVGEGVYREGARTGRGGVVQRTGAVPLAAPAAGWLESDQIEYLLDGDLSSHEVEVDSGHTFSFRG